MSVDQVIAEVRRQVEPLNAKVADHPFLEKLDQGSVPRHALQCFAGEQHAIMEVGVQSDAVLVARFANESDVGFFMGLLLGEKDAFAAVHRLAAEAGWGESDLQAYQPQPGAFAYAAYFNWLANNGSVAEIVASVLVNFQAWGKNCGRMAQALETQYGFANESLELFRLFAVPSTLAAQLDPFEQDATRIIDAALQRGEPSSRLVQAARLMQSYELMFWDTMLEQCR